VKKLIYFGYLFFCCSLASQKLPEGFVYLHNIAPTIQKELRYFSENNFIGKPIEGYQKNSIIISSEAAKALKKIQQIVLVKGYCLKIFDAYRPQQSVAHFVRWANVLNDTLMKKEYYPNISKSELFKQGYIASKSSHSRGSTVDLTLVNVQTKKELDMGSPYDFFGVESHPFYKNISENQKDNRLFLRKIMTNNGFKPLENEWWHFTLKLEPFAHSYFNFPVH
jgi:D-alanyl-D-alanine dipeptidase